MMETVRITFPSGVEVYSPVAEVQAGAGYSIPRLKSVGNVYRAINMDKVFENSSIEITLDNTDGYFSAKMSGPDQYIKGALLEYYDGTDLIFRGKISRIPKCPLTEFHVVADIQQAGLNAPLNAIIRKSDFVNVPADNEGKWGNIIVGTADDTGGAAAGMCTAYRVATNLFLAAWHGLHSLLSVFDSAGTNITASCTLTNGEKIIDGGMEVWTTTTNLTHWTEVIAGTSTISREASVIHGGLYSCKFSIDSSGSVAQIYQNQTWRAGESMRLSFWYNCPAGIQLLFQIKNLWNSDKNLYLTNTGTWTATPTYLTVTGTGAWTRFTRAFRAHTSYTEYTVVFLRGGNSASNTLYLDDVSIEGASFINYTSADLEIYFNVQGLKLPSAFIENPGTALNELNVRFGSFTIDGIAAASTVYTQRAYTGISIVISDDTTWSEFLQKFAHDWDALIFMQAIGDLKIKVLEWGNKTPVASIPEIYIHEYETWREIEKIVNEYKRMYWYHWRKNYFHRLPSDVTATTAWAATSDNIDLRYHSDDGTSRDVAAGILFFQKTPAIYYRVKVESSVTKALEIGDVVNIRYDRGYHPGEYRMMQIFKKEKIGGDNCYYLEGIDITDINCGLIKLWNDADAEIYLLLSEITDPDCRVLL